MKIGFDPGNASVVLVTGADFDAVFTYKVGGVETDWPVDTEIWLWFDDPAIDSWEATVAGASATFAVDKAIADTVPSGTGVRLLYVNGTDDKTLTIGQVERR